MEWKSQLGFKSGSSDSPFANVTSYPVFINDIYVSKMTAIKPKNIFCSISNTEGKSSAELYGSSVRLFQIGFCKDLQKS